MPELNTETVSGLNLLNALGSFWREVFTERDVLQSFLDINGEQYNQTLINLVETLNTLSRFNCPVFHRENWVPYTIKKSDLNYVYYTLDDGALTPKLLDGTYSLNEVDQDVYTYTRIPAPDNLKTFSKVVNSLTKPTVEYAFNDGVLLVNGYLQFNNNLFDQEFVKRHILSDDGTIIDEEITIWISKADFDTEYLYKHFGYILGLKLESSSFYKEALNSLWSSYNSGLMSKKRLTAFIAALLKVPVVSSNNEVITGINKSSNITITTDKNTYIFNKLAEVTTTIGATVNAGDTLVKVVDIIELGNADFLSDYLDRISYITFYKSFISGDYRYGLTFYNTEEDLMVYPPDNYYSKLRIRFKIHGLAEDVLKFWGYVDSYDKWQLAELMNYDNNEELYNPVNPIDTWSTSFSDSFGNTLPQPTYNELPNKINPLKFVIRNFVGNNLFIIMLHATATDYINNAVGLVTYLREIIPVTNSFIMVIMTNVEDDSDIDTTTYSETQNHVIKFKGNLLTSEDYSDVSEVVRAYTVRY